MPRPLTSRSSRTAARQRPAGIALVGLAAVVAVAALAGYATFRIWSQGYTDETHPADAIVGEAHVTSTLASLLGLRDLFAERGIRSAVLVSDRGHMLRVIRMAGDIGIEVLGSPTDESPSDATLSARARATVHELGALGWYLILGQSETGG